jgi:hypothetical protein
MTIGKLTNALFSLHWSSGQFSSGHFPKRKNTPYLQHKSGPENFPISYSSYFPLALYPFTDVKITNSKFLNLLLGSTISCYSHNLPLSIFGIYTRTVSKHSHRI